MSDENRFTNRLIHEKSPYLLQHAHNPVDWYPWGDEAFSAAKLQDKPIFLSIGYATCHWCHVMERESFENLEIAQLLNEAFINIKVDREELPEVDNLYMEFAQSMMAGAAGWPLNVILTPSLEPFFAATYLPPSNKQGLVGLQELIARISEIWKGDERERVLMQAAKIVEVFRDNNYMQGTSMPAKQQVVDAAELLFKMADPAYGGIKGAPKFPIGYQSSFLLRYSAKTHDSRALFLAERTLDMMHRGGIYDHLGGGFSRYSVDEKWLVPHFEKMLYDNALLITSYIEAFQLTHKPLYREVCEEIIGYVLRDLTHAEGGFFSAEDSESEGHEGKFYIWSYEEVMDLLQEGNLFCEFYDITPEGNFEGKCILNTPVNLEEFAEKRAQDVVQLGKKFQAQRQLLWKVRENRIHPLKDDKLLASWNGLMAYSLVNAGAVLGVAKYIKAAEDSLKFLKAHLFKDGKLLRRWRDGQAQYLAGLEDYAAIIRASISLFEADCGSEWLQWAIELADYLQKQYKSDEGAFYQTDGSDESILIRKSHFADGAEPSGNSLHCENLLRLYRITNNLSYKEQAEDIFKAVKRYLDSYAPGYVYHVMNLQRYYDKQSPTIIISLNADNDLKSEICHLLYSHFISHKQVVWNHAADQRLRRLLPYLEDYPVREGETTVYICHEGHCQEPLFDWTSMQAALKNL